jgi:ABC-2 type transport system ATP-binding protein
MSNPIVEVQNLREAYGEKVAVADVSFVVAPGEIFGVLGPNGSGKSTAVECIAGLRDADGGHIRVLGIDPQTQPELIREHVGVQFQQAGLHDKITVREALTLFASSTTRRRRRRPPHVLGGLAGDELRPCSRHWPSSCSSGGEPVAP